MLLEIIKIECDVVSSGQSLETNKSRGSWVEVDGTGESDDQILKGDVEAVTGEVSMVGNRVDHGARASACIC